MDQTAVAKGDLGNDVRGWQRHKDNVCLGRQVANRGCGLRALLYQWGEGVAVQIINHKAIAGGEQTRCHRTAHIANADETQDMIAHDMASIRCQKILYLWQASELTDIAMTTGNSYPPQTAQLTGPMVWQRDDLMQSSDWRMQVSGAQMDELDKVLLAMADQPVVALAERRDLLPRWQESLTHIRDELDKGRGLVLLRGIDAARYTLEQLRRLYWLLATCVGEPMIQNAVGELLGEVIDRGHDYQANNVRGYTTSAALAFHCDPADVVALLCVHPAKSGGTSHIVSASAVHNEIARLYPQFLRALYRGFHFDLRGEGAKGERDEVTEHRVPVFHYHHGRLSMRFNHKTIVDGMRKAGLPLAGDDLAAVDCVAQLSCRPDLVADMDFEVGDIQWLSNYDCLHARGAFIDWPEPERKRRLLRIWLNLRGGRPLRDDFSDRFNNGPRQGPKPVPGAGYWAGA